MWLPDVGKLVDKIAAPLSLVEANYMVANLINSHGEWSVVLVKWRTLFSLIFVSASPHHGPRPSPNRPNDRVAWGCAKDGEFSTASAYEFLLGFEERRNCNLF